MHFSGSSLERKHHGWMGAFKSKLLGDDPFSFSLCTCLLRLFHSCTFVSLVTELSCALDHFSNAFALAQGASQNRVPFDMVAER